MATPKIKLPDTENLDAYMKELQHPLKDLIAELRKVILSADKSISERIKWKAPSYHVSGTDFLTFNPRDTSLVHLIFHHPLIETMESPILESKLKGRRMVYFKDAAAFKKNKSELVIVIQDLLKKIK